MKKKEPRSLQEILNNQPDSIFTRLAAQQSKNDTLLARIKAVLRSHIAQHLVAVTYREEVLVLVADSPEWANRLRFESENLREDLISAGYFAHLGSTDEKLPCIKKIVTRTAADKIL